MLRITNRPTVGKRKDSIKVKFDRLSAYPAELLAEDVRRNRALRGRNEIVIPDRFLLQDIPDNTSSVTVIHNYQGQETPLFSLAGAGTAYSNGRLDLPGTRDLIPYEGFRPRYGWAVTSFVLLEDHWLLVWGGHIVGRAERAKPLLSGKLKILGPRIAEVIFCGPGLTQTEFKEFHNYYMEKYNIRRKS